MKKLLIILLAILALSGLLLGLYAWWAVTKTPVSTDTSPIVFSVRAGQDIRRVGNSIQNAGANIHMPLFMLAGRLTGTATKIKVGTYRISSDMTILQILNMLAKGDTYLERLSIPEGWTFRQMRRAIDNHPKLKHDSATWQDTDILQAIGATETHPEGLFFPDTYQFAEGSSDIEIYKIAYQTMKQKLNAGWQARDPSVPYQSPYEALIMASIVEKETGHPEDRAHVAGVFVNRLRRGMRLQTDPTVIYGMGDRYTGVIRRIDLQTDTPYNTYTRGGLPPTPIALPGYKAIEAAMRPAATSALYFVARGDNSGKSQFSDTLNDHNTAVRAYRQRQAK